MNLDKKTAVFRHSKQYLDYLWWNMHHSDDPHRQTFAITCYLDESGTDNQSQYAVVAGLVLDRDSFLIFDAMWNELLLRHRIDSPLHMKEFGPHGKHRDIDYPERYALFSDIMALINCYKTISLGGIIDQKQLNNIMTKKSKKSMGVYGLCFILCVFLYCRNALDNKNIAYLLDSGNKHSGHILAAYNELKIQQKKLNTSFHLGSLNFDSDENISALQAADVVAWAVRRRVMGLEIGKGFQPISAIIDRNNNHVQASWEEDWLKNALISFVESINIHGL